MFLDASKFSVPRLSIIAAVFLGAVMGGLVLQVIEMEAKWFLYILLGIIFITAVLATKNRQRFFWVLFIMSLQIYVSFRLLYGHAGSGGFEFPLAFVCGVILLGYYISTGYFSGKNNFIFGGYFLTPILLLFGTTFASLLFTSERFVGLVNLWGLLQYYMFYLIGLNCIRSKKQLDKVLSLLIIVLVLQSIVYFAQAMFGITFTLTGDVRENFVGVRAGGTVGANSAIFATFIAPLVMIVIVRLMSIDAVKTKRIGWFLLAVVAAIAIVLTLRRGAWGGYALGIISLLILGYRRRLLSKGWLVTSMVSLIILLMCAPIIANIVDGYRTGNPLSSAFDERMRLNKIALEVIKANLLLGTGPGSYSHVYKEYLNDALSQGWLFTVHNTYLLAAAEKGLPGILAVILFLYYVLKLGVRLTRHPDKSIRSFGLAMVGYIVSYAFIIYWEPMIAFSPNALLWFLLGAMGSIASWQYGSNAVNSHRSTESSVTNPSDYMGIASTSLRAVIKANKQ